ncbi:MAG: putative prokaryotic signal transducing protein [Actinomycetota bacterium]|jgi:hypothetical protein|nr:putative prokaryotic signal transducing protein [Actinomycetota bacterium]MEA2509533.1 putative prokaryotic signal transducing protein [Actinomycetota bacterium]
MPSRLDVPPLDRPPANVPPTPVGERGGDSQWIELTKARNDIDAHLLVGRLQEGGIDTRTLKDRNALGAWIYAGSNPWAPVAVLVRRFQLDDARLILMEISLDAPSAYGERANRRSFSGHRAAPPLLWWATALLLGLLFSALAMAQLGGLR